MNFVQVRKELEAEGWIFSSNQLSESERYTTSVLSALNRADKEIANSDRGDGVEKKRSRDEMEKENSAEISGGNFKEGDCLHESLPNIKVNTSMSVPQSILSSVSIDIEGAEYIGARLRRIFRNSTTPSDGSVVAFLPSFLNDGIPLWHVLHDDADEEDLDYEEVKRGVRVLRANLTAPEVEDEYDGEHGNDESDGEQEAPEVCILIRCFSHTYH